MTLDTGTEWRGLPVFVTGHTGFKGSWLTLWLANLGAAVTGYALQPKTQRDLFVTARIGEKCRNHIADVRDADALDRTMQEAQPSVVFHLAAQPLVGLSYRDPRGTYDTNVMGTVNVLEAARKTPSVKAIVVITSDKCYENKNTGHSYHEGDRLGGHDPYSCSKAACELVAQSYREAFFEGKGIGVATVRAGNVIGGGDWSEGRILPDCYRSLLAGKAIEVRSPEAIRPWQHVLEPLGGYMALAQGLLKDPHNYAGAWNFGPEAQSHVPVRTLADFVVASWGSGSWVHRSPQGAASFVEAKILHLDISKAKSLLPWRPIFSVEEAVTMTSEWYKDPTGDDAFTLSQIEEYTSR